MPYKHGVTGSSPVVPTTYLARWCSRLARQPVTLEVDGSSPFRVAIKRGEFRLTSAYASVAQLVEQWTDYPCVVGSTPTGGTICGCSSSGRAPPCQGGGSEFEPRHPLQSNKERQRVPYFIWCRGQAVRQRSAKPSLPGSNPGVTSMIGKQKRSYGLKASDINGFPIFYFHFLKPDFGRCFWAFAAYRPDLNRMQSDC